MVVFMIVILLISDEQPRYQTNKAAEWNKIDIGRSYSIAKRGRVSIIMSLLSLCIQKIYADL